MVRIIKFGITIVFCACFLGACGSPEPPTHAEFVVEANSVCSAAREKVRAMDAPDPTKKAATVRVAEQVVQIERKALSSLRAITAPDVDAANVDRWLGMIDQTLNQSEISVRAQTSGNLEAARQANENGQLLNERASHVATQLGVTSCIAAETGGTSSP